MAVKESNIARSRSFYENFSKTAVRHLVCFEGRSTPSLHLRDTSSRLQAIFTLAGHVTKRVCSARFWYDLYCLWRLMDVGIYLACSSLYCSSTLLLQLVWTMKLLYRLTTPLVIQ